MDQEELAVLRHLKRANVDYGKSIAVNTGIPLQKVLDILEKLEALGLVERVRGGKTLKRTEARYKLSHEVRKHHVYYRLTRKGRHLLRQERGQNP
ncbi:DUF2250 domain-containing protein [Pyrobaculum neutrophilum]|uniref:DUF2250 domain-containing protein n=1 Tax=Pyrobaculum neutrophilum (strain DSM 2338 / JCM 9278 / NBRC 100436 / V24Sta) TaxID=444157 RepID=B1YE23_PYRNV|nr:DUF2250 domain-containing protein [Pyrobaculum neutrophilum]ACB40036.1 conserved hypothetical protein [Pyrobaculum neutrophilum V24Sta]